MIKPSKITIEKTKEKMKIRNLNSEKIAKLTKEQVNEINIHFKEEEELLKYFNYSII